MKKQEPTVESHSMNRIELEICKELINERGRLLRFLQERVDDFENGHQNYFDRNEFPKETQEKNSPIKEKEMEDVNSNNGNVLFNRRNTKNRRNSSKETNNKSDHQESNNKIETPEKNTPSSFISSPTKNSPFKSKELNEKIDQTRNELIILRKLKERNELRTQLIEQTIEEYQMEKEGLLHLLHSCTDEEKKKELRKQIEQIDEQILLEKQKLKECEAEYQEIIAKTSFQVQIFEDLINRKSKYLNQQRRNSSSNSSSSSSSSIMMVFEKEYPRRRSSLQTINDLQNIRKNRVHQQIQKRRRGSDSFLYFDHHEREIEELRKELKLFKKSILNEFKSYPYEMVELFLKDQFYD